MVLVVSAGFFWPPPVVAVLVVSVGTGIGEVGDGIEMAVEAVLSWPLESEPQPTRAPSSAAAARVSHQSCRPDPVHVGGSCSGYGSGSRPSSSSTPKVFSAKATMW